MGKSSGVTVMLCKMYIFLKIKHLGTVFWGGLMIWHFVKKCTVIFAGRQTPQIRSCPATQVPRPSCLFIRWFKRVLLYYTVIPPLSWVIFYDFLKKSFNFKTGICSLKRNAHCEFVVNIITLHGSYWLAVALGCFCFC